MPSDSRRFAQFNDQDILAVIVREVICEPSPGRCRVLSAAADELVDLALKLTFLLLALAQPLLEIGHRQLG